MPSVVISTSVPLELANALLAEAKSVGISLTELVRQRLGSPAVYRGRPSTTSAGEAKLEAEFVALRDRLLALPPSEAENAYVPRARIKWLLEQLEAKLLVNRKTGRLVSEKAAPALTREELRRLNIITTAATVDRITITPSKAKTKPRPMSKAPVTYTQADYLSWREVAFNQSKAALKAWMNTHPGFNPDVFEKGGE